MLKLITTKSVTVATAATICGGHGDIHDRGAPDKGAAAGHKRRR